MGLLEVIKLVNTFQVLVIFILYNEYTYVVYLRITTMY